MIIDRGVIDGCDDEHWQHLGEYTMYTYKHELRSQNTRQVHVDCDGHGDGDGDGDHNGYDVVMIHLNEYASVNQVPKALVRCMLIVMVMVMMMVMMMRSFTTW